MESTCKSNRIENILNKQPTLFEEDDEVECLARHYATTIQHERIKQEYNKSQEPETERESEDYEEVNINSLCHSNFR